MTEPLEDRVRRLEDVAFAGDGLSRSVSRLGTSANALGEALLQVDRNQQQLTKLGQQLHEVDQRSLTKDEAKQREDVLRTERKRALGRLVFCLAFFVPLATYVAVWAHELYRDACDSGVDTPAWCAVAFPGDSDGNPLQDLVVQQANNLHLSCELRNHTTVRQAEILRAIAAAEPGDPQSAAIVQGADDMLADLPDCDKVFPVIDRVPGGHH